MFLARRSAADEIRLLDFPALTHRANSYRRSAARHHRVGRRRTNDVRPRDCKYTASGADVAFTGNIEGRDLLAGAAEVIVTDGFTGNVVLKTIEGTARAVADAVRAAARSGPAAMAGGLLLRRALGGLRERMDPDTTGGAVMLGLRRVAVVAHGSSGPAGIANAILLARRALVERAVERTAELLDASGATRAALRDRS